MQYRIRTYRQASRLLLLLGALASVLGNLPESLADSDVGQALRGRETSPAQTLKQSTPATKPQTDTKQSKASEIGSQKKDAGEQKTNAAASKEPSDKRSASPEEKRLQAMSLVEEALAVAKGISTIEYKVLTQVEGAAVLWPSDQARAHSILQDAVNASRQFMVEEKKNRVYKMQPLMRSYEDRESRAGRLWFAVLRKIAAISPTLIQELMPDEAKAAQAKDVAEGEFTEEARAMINVAYDQIEKDPALAARLAEQSLAQGMIDWRNFLNTLSQRDPGEAERLGIVLIDRLRESQLSPIVLLNLNSFFLAPARSAKLQEHFLNMLLLRLRRDLRTDITRRQLEDDLIVAQRMIPISAKSFPRWQPEFERLTVEIKQLFKSLSAPVPGPGQTKVIGGLPSAATPGNTNEIRDALSPVDHISDAQVRDKQYQKLAVDAALKADVKLAEDMLSRISKDDLRRETTFQVYDPLVRKALKEADWAEAQKLALKVADPLGRTLMLNRLAQTMLQAKQEKPLIFAVYREATSSLERDKPTSNIAQAWLLIVQSLFALDAKDSFSEVGAALVSLNKLADSGDLFKESELSQALSNWVSRSNVTLSAGEALYLPEMLGKTFGEMARRDEDRTLALTADLSLSLRSLAQIAVSREILKKAKDSTKQLPKTDK